MKLEVDGVQYINFTEATCEIRLDALSNSFNFVAVVPKGQPLPFAAGSACRVLVEDEAVLTGYMEIIDIEYDGGDHIVSVSGRDKTADILDSTLDSISDIDGENLTLKALIEKVIENVGADIQVIDEADPAPFSAAEDIASPEPGDNAFDFIEKYSRKRQVLLTSNGDGNIVIATNSGETAEGAVQHIIGAEDNNVISSSFSYDTTGRFNSYKMSSELNPVALNEAGDTDLASLVDQSGGVSDSDIRTGRQLVLVSEAPFSDSNCANRARWEADIRKARSLIYSAVVPGFKVGGNSGDLWQTNKLYQIVDDFVGKTEQMLCNSVTFSLNAENGNNTTLGFVGKDAYSLFIQPDPNAEVFEVGSFNPADDIP